MASLVDAVPCARPSAGPLAFDASGAWQPLFSSAANIGKAAESASRPITTIVKRNYHNCETQFSQL